MQHKVLNAQLRSAGSAAARKARRNGGIPGVVYGHAEPVAVTVAAREFDKAFHVINESELFTLKIGSDERDVLIKDYQEDIVSGRVQHVDFYEIERGKRLRTHVPINFIGTPKGTREGGVLETGLHEFEIECLPKDIVDHIDVQIAALEVGQSLHVRDIAAPDGIKILNSPDQVVVVVAVVRAAAAAAETVAEEAAPAAE